MKVRRSKFFIPEREKHQRIEGSLPLKEAWEYGSRGRVGIHAVAWSMTEGKRRLCCSSSGLEFFPLFRVGLMGMDRELRKG